MKSVCDHSTKTISQEEASNASIFEECTKEFPNNIEIVDNIEMEYKYMSSTERMEFVKKVMPKHYEKYVDIILRDREKKKERERQRERERERATWYVSM